MKISVEEVKKIAHLARLALTEQEVQSYTEEFGKILEWMQQLNELDTSEIEPLTYMHHNINIFREDQAVKTLEKAAGLFNAPQKDSDYFIIPKVID